VADSLATRTVLCRVVAHLATHRAPCAGARHLPRGGGFWTAGSRVPDSWPVSGQQSIGRRSRTGSTRRCSASS